MSAIQQKLQFVRFVEGEDLACEIPFPVLKIGERIMIVKISVHGFFL